MICDKCNKKMRRYHRTKEGFLCRGCWLKTVTIIKQFIPGPNRISLEEALDRTYHVKEGKNQSSGYLIFPKCLMGKKVKLVLIE